MPSLDRFGGVYSSLIDASSVKIDTQLLQNQVLLQEVSLYGTQWERISDFHEPKRTASALEYHYCKLLCKATKQGSPEEISSEVDPFSSHTSPKQSTPIEVGSLDGYQQQNYGLLASSTISSRDGHARYEDRTPTTPQREADTATSLLVPASGSLPSRLTVVRPGRTYSNPSDRGQLQAIDTNVLAEGNIATSGVTQDVYALCRSTIERSRSEISATHYGVGRDCQEVKSTLFDCALGNDVLSFAVAAFHSRYLNEQSENGQHILISLYNKCCALIRIAQQATLWTKETLLAILLLAMIEVRFSMSILRAF